MKSLVDGVGASGEIISSPARHGPGLGPALEFDDDAPWSHSFGKPMAFNTPFPRRNALKTYVFDVTVELDEDGRWAALCPSLPGCASWGHTREEALRNIREAVEAYVEDVVHAGEAVTGAREVLDAPAVGVVAG